MRTPSKNRLTRFSATGSPWAWWATMVVIRKNARPAQPHSLTCAGTCGARRVGTAKISKTDAIRQMQDEVLGEIQSGIDQGVLVEAPVTTLETLLAAPAITLVRRASLSGDPPEAAELERVFSLIWRGLSLQQRMAEVSSRPTIG